MMENEVDGLMIEERIVEGKRKEIGRGIKILGKNKEEEGKRIMRRGKNNLREKIIDKIMKGIGIEIERKLIEKEGNKIGNKIIEGGILRGEEIEREENGKERKRIVLKKKGVDKFWRKKLMDIDGERRKGEEDKNGEGRRKEEREGKGVMKGEEKGEREFEIRNGKVNKWIDNKEKIEIE